MQTIHQIEEKYSVCIHLIAINIQKFATELVSSHNVVEARARIKRASKEMHVNKDYALGKDDSEGLMAFYNNTPNNTIGLFWYPSDKNEPLFPRDFGKKPSWRPSINAMQNSKKQRKQDNYVAVKKRG